MAAEEVQNQSAYPPPPPFYVLYDREPPSPSPDGDPAEMTAEDKLLYTPPAPLDGDYKEFDKVETSGFRTWRLGPLPQLYEQDKETGRIDYATEMRRLNKEAFKEYVQLLRTLSGKPSEPSPIVGKIDPKLYPNLGPPDAPPDAPKPPHHKHLTNIRFLFINLTHLTNLMRPHQARQTLIDAQRYQIQRRKKRIKKLLDYVEEAKSFLAQHPVVEEAKGQDAGGEAQMDVEEPREKAAQSSQKDENDPVADPKKAKADAQRCRDLEELMKELDAL